MTVDFRLLWTRAAADPTAILTVKVPGCGTHGQVVSIVPGLRGEVVGFGNLRPEATEDQYVMVKVSSRRVLHLVCMLNRGLTILPGGRVCT